MPYSDSGGRSLGDLMTTTSDSGSHSKAPEPINSWIVKDHWLDTPGDLAPKCFHAKTCRPVKGATDEDTCAQKGGLMQLSSYDCCFFHTIEQGATPKYCSFTKWPYDLRYYEGQTYLVEADATPQAS